MTMDHPFDQLSNETIDLLEARLRRIEFAVCGEIPSGVIRDDKQTISNRMADLEHSLHQLAVKSRVVQDLLKLHAKIPDLFETLPSSTTPTTLDTSALLSIVLASASSYPLTASSLTSIRDTSIPPTELSVELINLQPRIAKLQAIQASQDTELRELRERTAIILEGWYRGAVIGAGEEWATLEQRLQDVEKRVRRASKEQEQEEV